MMTNPCIPAKRLVASAALAWALAPLAHAQQADAAAQPAKEDDTIELSPFEVSSDKDKGYLATNSTGGTKMNTPIKELPFTVDSITKDFLRDTGASDIASALSYTAGVDVIAGAGAGRTDTTISVRGLPSNFFLRDGVAFYRAPNWAMIERLEVVRGASAIVYGQTQPGGVVNMVTKKANVERDSGSVEQTIGQYSNFETRADYNIAAIPGKLGIRLAGSYADQESRRDGYSREAFTLSPSVVYKPLKGTTITLQYAKDYNDTHGIFFGLPPSNNESKPGFNYLNQNYQKYWDSKSPADRAKLKLPTPDSLKTASVGGPASFFLKDPYRYNVAGDAGRWFSVREDYVANLQQKIVEYGTGLVESSHIMVNVAYIDDDAKSRIPLIAMGAPQGARGFSAPWADIDLRDPANQIGAGNQWSIGGDYNDAVTNPMELINRNYYQNYNEAVPGAGNFAGSGFFNPADATVAANKNVVPLAGQNTYFWYPMTYFLRNSNQINTVDWVNVLKFSDSTTLRLLTGVEHGRQKYWDPGRKGNLPAGNFNKENDAWSSTAWGPAPSWMHQSTPMWGYGFAAADNKANTGQNPGTVWGAGENRKYRGWSVWNGDTGQRRGSHITGDMIDDIVLKNYYGLTQDIKYTALYSTGQLDLFNKKVQLLGALRYTNISKKDYRSQGVVPEFPLKYDPVVPQGGIVYNITPDVNVYVSYAQNYWYEWSRNANEINEVPPTNEGESYEVGTKFSLLDGKLTGSASIFQSAYQNLSWKDYTFNLTSVRPDRYPQTTIDANGDGTPDLDANGRPVLVDQFGLTRFDGEAETRGVEMALQARPFDGLDSVLSYSYLDTEITQGQEWAKGLAFSGVPEHMVSLWNKYGFYSIEGPFKGLEIGFGIVYKAKAFVGSGFNQKELGSGDVYWETPNFFRMDAMVAYPFKAYGKSCRVQVNCRNVADRLNWTADANLVPDGQGREFYGSFSVYF
jgi:outer membrane receptor protein involved in Fe transport